MRVRSQQLRSGVGQPGSATQIGKISGRVQCNEVGKAISTQPPGTVREASRSSKEETVSGPPKQLDSSSALCPKTTCVALQRQNGCFGWKPPESQGQEEGGEGNRERRGEIGESWHHQPQRKRTAPGRFL